MAYLARRGSGGRLLDHGLLLRKLAHQPRSRFGGSMFRSGTAENAVPLDLMLRLARKQAARSLSGALASGVRVSHGVYTSLAMRAHVGGSVIHP